MAPPTRDLERGEETVYMPHVVVDQLEGTVKLAPILNGHSAVQMSGDDVVITAALLDIGTEHGDRHRTRGRRREQKVKLFVYGLHWQTTNKETNKNRCVDYFGNISVIFN